ncbi:RecX family transcriptional regulator [Chengkuizengella axinellae]|uniref:Regulatory protein RecX n=1 Tax=Chengkuizengella axinellae TaxID=3064388 RepID=A0ABT9IVZ6_9BACL|nr:RecX family transcriptional regulator [Chengkuizengella sp. 2205SS18-9]MDP5273515.1 RecX family transcriptional regulator [Chengkuizengella sp. 2205SS18-9]
MTTDSAENMITLVEKQKNNQNRYNIYVNDQYVFSVHEDILVKHRLLKGEEINQTKMKKIIEDEETQIAYRHAIRMISRKPKSRYELKKKLIEKGYEESLIHSALDQLEKEKYIDDYSYAVTLANYRIKYQRKGLKWIEQELSQKGIEKMTIAKVTEEVDKESEYKAAYHLAQKRWERHDGDTIQKKSKISSFLMRRGFEYSLIRKVLQQIEEDESQEW